MNDFTKEELQIILLDMECYINRTPMLKESPSHKALRLKIESMINKYNECAHDPRETKDAVGMYHCPECGEMVVAGLQHVNYNT